jgi:hypothetical protein
MIEKHSTGHIPVMVSATDFTTIALALAEGFQRRRLKCEKLTDAK